MLSTLATLPETDGNLQGVSGPERIHYTAHSLTFSSRVGSQTVITYRALITFRNFPELVPGSWPSDPLQLHFFGAQCTMLGLQLGNWRIT